MVNFNIYSKQTSQNPEKEHSQVDKGYSENNVDLRLGSVSIIPIKENGVLVRMMACFGVRYRTTYHLESRNPPHIFLKSTLPKTLYMKHV